jgi:hypothetical protein
MTRRPNNVMARRPIIVTARHPTNVMARLDRATGGNAMERAVARSSRAMTGKRNQAITVPL